MSQDATEWLYLDRDGVVRVGLGVLADPIERALEFSWTILGRPATVGQVRDAWLHVKSARFLIPGGRAGFEVLTNVRVSVSDVHTVHLLRK